jgi:hypothetical protein
LGMIMCVLVAYLSLFKKQYVTGDFRWFVLNQAIANFINSTCNLLTVLIITIYLGPAAYSYLYFGPSRPLWLWIFVLVNGELQKVAYSAQMTTLFATLFNRWLAITKDNYYPTLMSHRLIVLYCMLCFIVVLLIDPRLFTLLSFPELLTTMLIWGTYMIPWSLSVVLAMLTYRSLRKHMRAVSCVQNEERLKEDRSILRAILLQIAVPLLDKVPGYVLEFFYLFNMIDITKLSTSTVFFYWGQITNFNTLYSATYTCLVILITMRPYRVCFVSLVSPLIKRCQPLIKTFHNQKIHPLDTSDENSSQASHTRIIRKGGLAQ